MQALDPGFCHLIGDRVIPIAGETVDARTDHEMGSSILGGAEEFVDVALTVADMDALCWLIHQRRGLSKIFQPPNAFLELDGNPRWVDLALERSRSLEFVSGPEPDRSQPQRQTIGRDR